MRNIKVDLLWNDEDLSLPERKTGNNKNKSSPTNKTIKVYRLQHDENESLLAKKE